MSDNQAIFGLLGEIRKTQLEQAEKHGAMASDIRALAGPEGRVTKLEKTQVRQWWVSVAIAPLLAGLHAALRKFGVNY